jgi:hypothetical protein
MGKTQVTIQVDQERYREFKAECIRRATTPTKEIAVLIDQRLMEWLPTNVRHKESKNA